jgi:ribosomal protein S18 acetylase RimI-like enzyme
MTTLDLPLSDQRLADAGHANQLEWMREMTRWSGRHGELEESDGLLLRASATNFPVAFNGVARLDPSVPADETLRRADAWFAARGRGYSVLVCDREGRDDDLRAAVDAAGYLKTSEPPEMVLRQPLDPVAAPAGIELRWVDDQAGLAQFLAVCSEAYGAIGMPPGVVEEAIVDLDAVTKPWIHSVVAIDGEQPLAAAQVLLSHGVAGIYWVGTVPAARGRGLGEAVTRAVADRGFRLGAAAVTLQASAQGEPIYRRLGFEALYRYENWSRFEIPSAE